MERNSAAERMHMIMYQDALMSLSSGCLDPVSREILSLSPLPPDYTDSYCETEVDAKQAVELAYSALTVWAEEAKKADYFSKRFVQLSRLVMNGVTAMGRGLVSLHARGEDPAGTPMSIDELISLASYHFRKSYLGVLQTAKSHPEISERLLVNQLGWTNMILRLYKTKERLSKPLPVVRKPETALPLSRAASAVCGAGQSAPELPAAEISPCAGPAPLSRESAFSAPRAFSSYSGYNASPAGMNRAADKAPDADEKQETEAAAGAGNPEPENEKDTVPEFINDAAGGAGQGEGSPNESETYSPEIGIHEGSGGIPDDAESGSFSAGMTGPEEADELPPGPIPDEDAPGPGPDPEIPAGDPGTPRYLEILKNIFARSASPETDGFAMTYDEISFLASDPEYMADDPRSAARFGNILREIHSGKIPYP